MRPLVVLAFLLVACGASESAPAPASLVDRAGGKLTVGVVFDEPGIGVRGADGTFSGFDVDVARYVAGELGVPAEGVTFTEARPSLREKLLTEGTADLIVATYSITEKRKLRVSFAGPYFVAGQSVLVRTGSADITGPESLNGRTLCSVTGTTSATTVKEKYAGQVRLVEHGTYSDCVTALLKSEVDAVTTDDVILAGFAAQHPGQLRLVGAPFTVENYGIGIRKGDSKAVAAVAAAIKKMQSDGSWRKSLEKHIGPSGYPIPVEPAITER